MTQASASPPPATLPSLEAARYVTLSAGWFKIPASPLAASERRFSFHAPGLRQSNHVPVPGSSDGPAPVIFFRTRHEGRSPTFSVRLNGVNLTQYTFTRLVQRWIFTWIQSEPSGQRTWHEILPAGALKPQDNELVFTVSGQGTVSFSDVVILYNSEQLIIRSSGGSGGGGPLPVPG